MALRFEPQQQSLRYGFQLTEKRSHVSFPSSFRGKYCSNLQLVQFLKKDGRRFDWSFRCSGPSPESQSGRKVLQARRMEEIYDILANRLLAASSAMCSSSKYIVGLAGPPGGGKSTIAKEVTYRVNALWHQIHANKEEESGIVYDEVAIALPMDGFHLYRCQLDKMEDPAEAHARRGAPWTFDPNGLRKCLTTLRSRGWVLAPSFDHGVGDPKENDILVTRWHRVVLVEGNYLLLANDKWKDLRDFFDECWYLDVDMEITLNRVVERFVALGTSWDRAKARVEYNDRKNAEIILASKGNADLIIKSIELERRDSITDNSVSVES